MLSRMLYDLVFYLNLYLRISNQLGMVVIIIFYFYFLKTLSSFTSMNYTQTLSINLWLMDLYYFPLTLYSQWKYSIQEQVFNIIMSTTYMSKLSLYILLCAFLIAE